MNKINLCKTCIHYKPCTQLRNKRLGNTIACSLYEESKRPHGEWEKKPEICYDYFYCSECGYAYKHAFNFCPNCGADMREEGESN